MNLRLPVAVTSILGLSFLLAALPSAYAQDATFAPEFEFTNKKIQDGDYGESGQIHIDTNLKFQEKWAELMEDICDEREDCEVEERYDQEYAYEYDGDIMQDYYHPNYRVKYDDGFYYDITMDPAVIEIKLKPGTVEYFERNRDRIQKDIFDFAKKKMGLQTLDEIGGHIHMGVQSAFGGNMKLLRNYIVDIMNHQELWVVMGDDFSNAPPLSALPDSQFAAYKKIIADIDAGRIRDEVEFGKRMRNDVYNLTYNEDFVSEYDRPTKFQAVNVNRLKKNMNEKARTIEHRAFPVQGSADEFLGWIKLLQARLDYLRTKRGTKIEIEKFDLEDNKKWVSRFRSYVEESGLSFEDYRKHVLPELKRHDRCSVKLKKKKKRPLTP